MSTYLLEVELGAERGTVHTMGCSFDGMFVPGVAGMNIAHDEAPEAFDEQEHIIPERVHHLQLVDAEVSTPAGLALRQASQS